MLAGRHILEELEFGVRILDISVLIWADRFFGSNLRGHDLHTVP